MKRISFVVAAAAAVLATPVIAADMPVKAPRAPVMVPASTWTGCFVGAHIGGQWSKMNSSEGYPLPGLAASRDIKDTSFIGGGQVGCDYQFANTPWVIGIDGDLSWADHNGRAELVRIGVDHIDGAAKLGTQGSVRGRLGWAFQPDWLLYVAGGLAVAHAEASTIFTRDTVGSLINSRSDTLTGWTIGAGAEWRFAPQWSARLEYRHSDFGSIDIHVPAFTFPAAGFAYNARTTYVTNDVRLGVNFRF